ncbi:MAG: hypothetical protein ABJE47_19765 [bacterium]
MPARGRRLGRVAGWIAAALVIGFVGLKLGRDLLEFRAHPLVRSPDWSLVALSGGVFLVAHAVLVQTWLGVLSCWDARLPFWTAARIWSVSNLGKYLPGKVWQIGAMGAMSKEVGVSPLAATGSAILGALVNIMTGFVVVLVSGRALLDRLPGNWGTLAEGATVAACVALLAAPVLLPRLAPVVARATGRTFEATLPVRAVVYSLVGNVTAWLIYGAAFQLFAAGMLGSATGGYTAYLTAYTFSYVVGYVALFAPAGAGVREFTMLSALQLAGLATRPEAALVTVASRIWLTLLEVTPALVFWAHYRVRHRSLTTDPSDGSIR